MSDGSNTSSTDDTSGRKTRMARVRQWMQEWQIKQYVARGMAYGVGSGAVSLLLLWAQTRY